MLALVLNWTTMTIDFSNAFLHAPMKKPKFMHLPRGFKSTRKEKTCLKIVKSVYGSAVAPRLWRDFLFDALTKLGFKSCSSDPNLLYRDGMFLIVYVDDVGIAARNSMDIDKFIANLRAMGFELTTEGNFCEFLGIKFEQNDEEGTFTLTQPGLIKRIIEATKLEDCKHYHTPTTLDALGSDPEGPEFSEEWDYRSVIGMLLYLSNNTRPDITYAVSQAARFSSSPKQSHAVAVKRIVRYLAKTKDKGMMIKKSSNLNLDVYVDADFVGLFKSEPDNLLTSAKSRTGIAIQIGGAMILCKSQLQTEISLSTLEAEYSALSNAMRLVLPILRRLLLEVVKGLKLPPELASFKTTVHEDNNGALFLATNQRITSRTKYFLVKYHFFWDWVKRGDVKVEKVDTKDQIADIFTKGLPRETFKYLRHLLLGW
jgi:hypothetical protein